MELFDRDYLIMVIFWRLHETMQKLEERYPWRIVFAVSDWVYLVWAKRCYEPQTDFKLELAEHRRAQEERIRRRSQEGL